MHKIAKNIKHFRQLRGMSMRALELESGVSLKTINDIENEKKQDVGMVVLEALAEALGVSVGRLLK